MQDATRTIIGPGNRAAKPPLVAASPVIATIPGRRSSGVRIAQTSIALVLAGFAKTFFVRPLFTDVPLPSLAIVHGIVMALWLALFALQAWLVAHRRVALHRTVGVAGAILTPLVLVLAVAMAIDAMRAGHTPVPQVTPQQFLAIPLFNIVAFAGLAGGGLLLRNHRETHRRLMLLALLSVLPPAIARIPQSLDVLRAASLFLAIGVEALLVIACVLRDVRVHRRLHPVWILGGIPAVGCLPLALAVSHTAWWQRFAAGLM
jgi:hypothetical protein